MERNKLIDALSNLTALFEEMANHEPGDKEWKELDELIREEVNRLPYTLNTNVH